MTLQGSDVQLRVEAALEKDERTADYAIEVIDKDGLVTLKGKVGSAEDKQAAEEITAAQEGVVDVTNALLVEPSLKEQGDVVVSSRRIITNNPSTPTPR
ncbi:MAG: BON domain-containing protein [Anaerolineae bacterium]